MSFTKHDQNFIKRILQICESGNLKPQSKDYQWLIYYRAKIETLPRWKKELLLASGLYATIDEEGKKNLRISAQKSRIIFQKKKALKQSNALHKNQSILNSSGCTGVCWENSHSKWRAQIGYKGHNYFLGRYDYINDAIVVRKEAEKHLDADFLSWYKQRKDKW